MIHIYQWDCAGGMIMHGSRSSYLPETWERCRKKQLLSHVHSVSTSMAIRFCSSVKTRAGGFDRL